MSGLHYRIVCEHCGGSGVEEESGERGPCWSCGGRGSFSEDEYWGDADDQAPYDAERDQLITARVNREIAADPATGAALDDIIAAAARRLARGEG